MLYADKESATDSFGIHCKKLLKKAKIDIREIAINSIPDVPIWDSEPVTVDFTLSEFDKSSTSSTVFKSRFNEVKQKYLNFCHIYTDWSKDETKVSGFYYNVCLVFCQSKFNICVSCDIAFIEPMHRNKPNITYLPRTISREHEQPCLGDMYVGTSFLVYQSALRTWLGMSRDIFYTTFERFITMSQGHDQPCFGDMYVGISFEVYYSALRTWLGMRRDIDDTTWPAMCWGLVCWYIVLW